MRISDLLYEEVYVLPDGTLASESSYVIAGWPRPEQGTPITVLKVPRLIRVFTVPPEVRTIAPYAINAWAEVRSVVFPEGLERICNRAFVRCPRLQELRIPAGVHSLEEEMLLGCNALRRVWLEGVDAARCLARFPFKDNDFDRVVTPSLAEQELPPVRELVLPEGLEEIPERCFMGSRMEEAVLPESVRVIGSRAFSSCRHLRKIRLPAGLEKIEQWAFHNTDALHRVTLPEGLRVIGRSAFNCSGLVEAELPDSVTELGEVAFSSCWSLRRVKLPAGLPEIRQFTFRENTALEEIIWPAALRTIRASAFAHCGLAELALPEGVTEVQRLAFNACAELREIRWPASLRKLDPLVLKGSGAVARMHHAGTLPLRPDLLLPEGVEITWARGLSGLPPLHVLRDFVRRWAALTEDVRASLKRCLRLHAKSICRMGWHIKAPELFGLMLRERLIPAHKFDECFPLVQAAGNTEQTAALLAMAEEPHYRETLRRLRARRARQELTLEDPALRVTVEQLRKKRFTGLHVAGHGPLRSLLCRTDARRFFLGLGMRLTSAADTELDVLICANPAANTEKLRRAARRGVLLLAEQEAEALFGHTMYQPVAEGCTAFGDARHSAAADHFILWAELPAGLTSLRLPGLPLWCEMLRGLGSRAEIEQMERGELPAGLIVPDGCTVIDENLPGMPQVARLSLPDGMREIQLKCVPGVREIELRGGWPEQLGRELAKRQFDGALIAADPQIIPEEFRPLWRSPAEPA